LPKSFDIRTPVRYRRGFLTCRSGSVKHTTRSAFSKFSQNMAGGRFAGVDAAVPIPGDAFRQRAVDGAAHDAVSGAAEADPGLVLDVGDIDGVVGGDQQTARPAELRPLLEVAAVLIENLQTLVAAVGDEDAAAAVDRDGVRHAEFTRPGPLLAPGLDEAPILRKFHDAIVHMAIGHEDVAVVPERHVGGPGKC